MKANPNAQMLLSAGLDALGRGDAAHARVLLQNAAAANPSDSSIVLAIAQACGALKDVAGRIRAIDSVLQKEPRNIRALVLKADHFLEGGDDRAASAFYLAALRAAPPPEQVKGELVGALQRAQDMCARFAARYQEHLHDRLKAHGFEASRSSRRFSDSLDILFGTARVYLQQPRYYYFPGLPQIQFFERDAFPWLDEVESATQEIRAELLEVLKDERAFTPYLQGDPRRPRNDQNGMLNNPAWSAFYLWKNGELVPENAARCPNTLRALRNVPLARVPNRSPSVLFSLLRPGARIPPHNGLANIRLICHLPLIVPDRCGFRVGSEVRGWVEGKAWLFDDTIEHEAWNESDQTRVILLFDVWRPEITTEEQGLLGALFDAIDAYNGEKPNWEI